MRSIQRLLEQISTWSRAMQWAFWAGALTVAFLIWDATIAELGAQWSAAAASKETQIAELRRPTTLTSTVKTAISSFGEVELPREKAKGATALTEAVHNILSNFNVEKDKYTRTKTSRMKSGSLPGITTSGEQLEQVIGDILFEATQEDALAVISALESSPWIDAVSNIRFTKQDGRMIRVDLSVEAWVISKSQKRGRR